MPTTASIVSQCRTVCLAAMLALAPLSGVAAENNDDPEFASFLSTLAAESAKAGVSPATFDRATRGMTRDPEVIALATAQPEHDMTVGAYVRRLVTPQRVETGRARLADLAPTLAAIEQRYGVDRHILVAIWGVESSYGTAIGERNVIRSLASLAVGDQRRAPFWRRELLAALAILQQGDATAEQMVGSWAGAVGQTQFIPTTFRAHAVDFDADGRRDLWRTPADALASAAAYVQTSGWRRGQSWGLEVILPAGFDVGLSGEQARRPASAWRDLGVIPAAGRPWPEAMDLRLLLPAGSAGPAFLVGAGFDAVLRYNPATSYALAVSLLADRIAGAPELAAAWPEGDRALARAEREDLQRLLAAAGYDPGPVDGVLGGLTRAALRSYQRKQALPPDGYPDPTILQRLRKQQTGVQVEP